MRSLLIVLVFVIGLSMFGIGAVAAQPPHSCTSGDYPSVVYNRVDDGGYAPRLGSGSQAIFACIAARDPHFADQRFDSESEALNYWFGLYGQELGEVLLRLPSPTQ